MLFWTHLVIGLFGSLLFLGHVNNWVGFLIMGLIGSIFLDIDSPTSKLGKKRLSKVLMAFNSHRGIVHSLLFVFFSYFLLSLIFGNIALGFFIGASIHLLLDCRASLPD